jgi:hypothetical protein
MERGKAITFPTAGSPGVIGRAGWLSGFIASSRHLARQHRRRLMEFEIPQSLKLEHEELHAALVQATKEPGETGAAAKAVAALLHPHFVREEEFALPPLGLLAPLARGERTAGMSGVLELTEKLKASLPQMLAEHRAIVGALDKLEKAARADGRSELAEFADKLKLHAQTEEEVSYPAAILVGEYVKLTRDAPGGRPEGRGKKSEG